MIKYIKLWIFALFFTIAFQNCNSQDDLAAYKTNGTSIKTEESTQDLYETNNSITADRQNAITRTVQMAEDAIVGINVTEVREIVYRDPLDFPFLRFFLGERRRRYKVQGLGSGFIISSDGYILTNHHVAGNATKIVVTMTDGSKHNATIVGSDMTSDVALLKIDGEDLPYLKLGNSDNILLGEWVIAFGNPFGLFDLNAKPTVTVGVVSNKDIDFAQEGRIYKGMIQTDAAISSGNSGGPLLNALGEVVGINTVIYSTAQSSNGAGSIGIGWAIPINRIKNITKLLKKDQGINRDFETGIDVKTLDENLAHYLGTEPRDGVVVVAVNTRSAAGKAGIEPGDIITEINGHKISDETDYYMVVLDKKVGDKLNIQFIRDGKDMSVSFILPQRGFRRGRR
jgi:serine protease Do